MCVFRLYFKLSIFQFLACQKLVATRRSWLSLPLLFPIPSKQRYKFPDDSDSGEDLHASLPPTDTMPTHSEGYISQFSRVDVAPPPPPWPDSLPSNLSPSKHEHPSIPPPPTQRFSATYPVALHSDTHSHRHSNHHNPAVSSSSSSPTALGPALSSSSPPSSNSTCHIVLARRCE
eukprot:g59979.t1